MIRKQKQIRKVVLILLAIVVVIAIPLSVNIKSAKSGEEAKQIGKYEVQEITASDSMQGLSGQAAYVSSETITGAASIPNASGSATESSGTSLQTDAKDPTSPVDSASISNGDTSIKSNEDGQDSSSQSSSSNEQQNNAVASNVQNVQNQAGSTQGSTNQNTNNQTVVESVPTQAPQDDIKKEYITCTIEVRCDVLVQNPGAITDENFKQYIPADGIILGVTHLKVEKGATVYDALAQVCQNHGIQIDTNYTPMYKSYYVKGIAYLYERKAGISSGWRYSVNGTYPSYGSSYKLEQSDVVVWSYSLDLGQ